MQSDCRVTCSEMLEEIPWKSVVAVGHSGSSVQHEGVGAK